MTGYTGTILFNCFGKQETESFGYPFDFHLKKSFNNSCHIFVSSASTSDATFFVTTGVLSMLYAILIIFVYVKFEEKYKIDTKLPLFVSIYISQMTYEYWTSIIYRIFC